MSSDQNYIETLTRLILLERRLGRSIKLRNLHEYDFDPIEISELKYLMPWEIFDSYYEFQLYSKAETLQKKLQISLHNENYILDKYVGSTYTILFLIKRV